MSKKRRPFRGRRATALAGMGLMLAQLAAAGQPARVHFAYVQSDKSDLCLTWEKSLLASATAGKLHLVGHLYGRSHGGACDVGRIQSHSPVTSAPIAGSRDTHHGPAPLPLAPVIGHGPVPHPSGPLADQTIHLSYKAQGTADSSAVLPESLTTDGEGRFELDVPKSHIPGGMVVKAAYYGQLDKRSGPLAQDEKKLLPPHLEVDILDEHDARIDPDKKPAGPTGTYHLSAHAVGWYGEPLLLARPPQLEELKPLFTPQSPTGVLSSGVVKEIEIRSRSVTGVGVAAGIATIRAVTDDGGLESGPVLLPFGAHMTLERLGTDTHSATEEVILQRPRGYNDDEGRGGEFFMDEHAWLRLKLTSLLSGRPLQNAPFSWHVLPSDSDNIQGSLGKKAGRKPNLSAERETGQQGSATIAVSARHAAEDDSAGAPGGRAYQPAVGKLRVLAGFKGQLEAVKVPFIDSLWLTAHLDDKTAQMLHHWPLRHRQSVSMMVDGYVGLDGGTAKRELVPFKKDDHSVAVEADNPYPLSAGPVFFGVTKTLKEKHGLLEMTNPMGTLHNWEVEAGFAYRDAPGQLTAYMKALTEGPFCLEQNWNHLAGWRQAGATLKVAGSLCGKIYPDWEPEAATAG